MPAGATSTGRFSGRAPDWSSDDLLVATGWLLVRTRAWGVLDEAERAGLPLFGAPVVPSEPRLLPPGAEGHLRDLRLGGPPAQLERQHHGDLCGEWPALLPDQPLVLEPTEEVQN